MASAEHNIPFGPQHPAWNPRWGRSIDYEYLMSHWFRDVPFDIVYMPDRGRFMVATRDLKSGEKVIRSFPYCYAVCHEVREQVCAYCFRNVVAHATGVLEFGCPDCQQTWYCSEQCRQMDSIQHDLECNALKLFFTNVHWDEPGNCTEVKLLFRTLSRRTIENERMRWPAGHFLEHDPIRFDDFMRLTHRRESFGKVLVDSLRDIVEYIKGLDTWFDSIDVETVLDVVLKTRNNMFNVFYSVSDSLGWGVYVEASLFNHSCMPNSCLFRTHGDPSFQFVVMQDVKAGDELTITYLGYGDLLSRREHLKEHYFFHCQCARCVEEENDGNSRYTEWFNNYHCHVDNCLGYSVKFHKPDGTSEWRCNYCSFIKGRNADGSQTEHKGEPEHWLSRPAAAASDEQATAAATDAPAAAEGKSGSGGDDDEGDTC